MARGVEKKKLFYSYLNQKGKVPEGETLPPPETDPGKLVTTEKEKVEVFSNILP